MEAAAAGRRDAIGIDALPETAEQVPSLPGVLEQRVDRVGSGSLNACLTGTGTVNPGYCAFIYASGMNDGKIPNFDMLGQ